MPRARAIARKTRDGSVIHKDGRVLFFSIPRFIKDICAGDKCFVCGADPSKTPFNDEHVLPDWLLRKFSLHGRKITLPNLTGYRYGNYTIPCCATCNTRMGNLFEKPVSKLAEGGFSAFQEHLSSVGPGFLYTWLALLFLKTHLKDRSLRFHLDERKGTQRIAEMYEWEALHHVHCLARSFYTGAYLAPGVVGSLLLVRARVDSKDEPFDYADLYEPRTIMVRINDACLIAVLNDAGAASYHIGNTVTPRIEGPLHSVQVRELMAKLALVNLKKRKSPDFMTSVSHAGEVALTAKLHEWPPSLYKIHRTDWARILYSSMMPAVLTMRDKHGKLLGPQIKKGRCSFLFDDNDRFIKELVVPITADDERASGSPPGRLNGRSRPSSSRPPPRTKDRSPRRAPRLRAAKRAEAPPRR